MTDFETFWQTYPNDLCNRKGSRKESEKLWGKIDSNEYDKILICMRELIRSDRKVRKLGEFVPRWPMVATFLRQERWRDIEDIKQSQDIERLSPTCKCGQPIDFGPAKLCWGCYDKKNPADFTANREALRKIGLTLKDGETRQDYNARCRQYAQSRMGSIISRGTSIPA